MKVKALLALLFFSCLNCVALASDFDKGNVAYTASNFAEALVLYKKAAEQGDAQAQYKLGDMYRKGLGVEVDLKKSNTWYKSSTDLYRKEAEKGDRNAQHELAWAYSNGLGVEQNSETAIAWYIKSSEQGNIDSLLKIADLYQYGFGVKKDTSQAFNWYRKASERYRKDAIEGDPLAQTELGKMYSRGKGVNFDTAQAVSWYRKAVEQGFADAQYNLGVMYNKGKGVKEDLAKVYALWHKAAEQGHDSAQIHLAHKYYEKGDDEKAFTWYRKAAEKSVYGAQSQLAFMYLNGRGVNKNPVQAAYWYQKAADSGSSLAKTELGRMYEQGVGVEKDLEKALALYNNPIAKSDYERVNTKLNCILAAKTEIFGVSLKCASRNDFMVAIGKTKATIKREDKNYWSDIYYTSSVLKGSSELALSYSLEDLFAKATYIFPSNLNVGQVAKIKDFVASKYGSPQQLTGDPSLGKVTYKWELEDGIELTVSRGWPNTTTYLSYIYRENNTKMLEEQNKARKAREAKKHQSQDDAF